MKVMNKGNTVVNVVLASGAVALQKGQSVDMPEWVYKMLKPVFPGLTPVETVIEAEPAPIVEPKPAPKAEDKGAKVVKSKKSRK